MPTIIVCSNFSKTSRNALAYACALINNKVNNETTEIFLLNVYTIPANYSGDGIALSSINDMLDYAEEDLKEELDWVHLEFPLIKASGKVTTGRLLNCLEEQIRDTAAWLVIIGSGGHYGDLWSWDANILTIVRDLPVPVLTIPPEVSFKPLQNIGFACNLKSIHGYTPFHLIKNIIHFTGAALHVIYVTAQQILPGSVEANNELLVQNELNDLAPAYHILNESEIVGAIGHFVEDKNIRLLLVIPRKHGIWESLFHKSFTRELARLNNLPVIALH